MSDKPHRPNLNDPRDLIDHAAERLLSALRSYNAAHTAAVQQGRHTPETAAVLQTITDGVAGLLLAGARFQRSIKEPVPPPPPSPKTTNPTRSP